jgi:hypothetical protein
MTQYLPRDIRQIKLTNGEEIITEVVGEDREEFLIRNPLLVHREKVQLGDIAREANMFTRWMSLADNDEFIISRSHILVEALVNDAVAIYYNKMTANIEQDLKTPITALNEAPEPEVAQATPTLHLLNEEDDGTPPTFH